jgi:predicted AAA+ superfamily ATPase
VLGVVDDLRGKEAGDAFEHYILMELIAHRGINDLDHDITYWRTKSGSEVDFILGNAEVAIEVKVADRIRKSDIHGLILFQKEYKPKKTFVVNNSPRMRKMEIDGKTIDIVPWNAFLKMLWNGEVI